MEGTEQFSVGSVADARSVAEAGLRAMKRGKRLVVPGLRNRLLLFAERFLPRAVVIRAVRGMQQKRISERVKE